MKGSITTIQRMSIHDGPGIRSTVFLKGCNFRCKWCHNPETWSSIPQLQLIEDRCILCGSCVDICIQSALYLKRKGVELDRSKCTTCGECIKECVSNALSIMGRSIEAQDVVREVMVDKQFYDESGGGITLSGGEPFLQPYFVKEIMQISKQYNLHTAIESNLSVPKELLEEMIPFVDLWLVDLKVADDTLHKQWTGNSNKRTIDNLRLLCDHKVEIVVRTPIIPGVNDTREAIIEICEVLSKLTIRRYELLPFHPLGFDKFRYLGMNNPMADTPINNVSLLDNLNDVVTRYFYNKKD